MCAIFTFVSKTGQGVEYNWLCMHPSHTPMFIVFLHDLNFVFLNIFVFLHNLNWCKIAFVFYTRVEHGRDGYNWLYASHTAFVFVYNSICMCVQQHLYVCTQYLYLCTQNLYLCSIVEHGRVGYNWLYASHTAQTYQAWAAPVPLPW